VLSQTYANIEYIIIDGGSKDGTIELVNSYGNSITKFVSEPDSGIYDAMNKGLKLATGDVIGILNSDDLYIENNVVASVMEQFVTTHCDVLYGDLYYVLKDNTDAVIRKWITKTFIPGSFKRGWHPPHPTFFVKKNIYDQYGYFNLKFKLAADFELMLRFLERYQVKSFYYQRPIVKMRLGGATNKRFVNIYKQNVECYQAFRANNIKVSLFYFLFRLVPKLTQFFNK
jgi:glycosyltransferase involved in cell wall biosynthesis